MKKIISLFSAALVAGLLVSCGGSKTEEPIVAPAGMIALDMNNYGKSFVLFVPDTTTSKLVINENQSGALEVRVGTTFGISINEQAGNIEVKKKDVQEDEVYKFKAFVKDEPTAILWESDFMDKSVSHFMVNMKIGTSDYCFEDIISTEAEPFSKENITKMFDSAKSIREKKKEQPST